MAGPVTARLYSCWQDFAGPWPWPNFLPRELACRCGGRFCGGEYWHDARFLDVLQRLRDALGAPVRITSAHRCGLWNAHVGGAPRSEHKTIAADIGLAGHEPARLFSAARDAGFGSFGLYRSFIHADLRPGRRWLGAGAQSAWIPILENSGETRRWWA